MSWWRQRRQSWWFLLNGRRSVPALNILLWATAKDGRLDFKEQTSKRPLLTRLLRKMPRLTARRLWSRRKRRPRWPRSGSSSILIQENGRKDSFCASGGVSSAVQVWAEHPWEGEFCHNGEDHWLNSPGQGTHQDWCWILQGDLFFFWFALK